MFYEEAERTIDSIMYPVKTSPIKTEEERQAISLAYESLKIVKNISERFHDFPEKVQEAFMDLSIFKNAETNDYAYKFVARTMGEIELLEDEEKDRDMPL